MPSASDTADLLRAFSSALRACGCRWYLFGAQAVTIWGRPRLTMDVDVTVHLASIDAAGLVACLAAVGFRLSGEFSDEFVRTTRVLPLVYQPSGVPVDVVLAGPGLEERFLERTERVKVGDFTVPVISPEDLIVTKVLAGREKDIEDIRGILEVRGDRLDAVYVRETLTMIEDALGQSALLRVFETALSRGRAKKRE